MDPLQIILDWAGWPFVWAMTTLGGTFYLLIIRERISYLKEKNQNLIRENQTLSDFRPDILAERLSTRVKTLTEELEQLDIDNRASEELIKEKEAELSRTSEKIKSFISQLISARTTLETISEHGLVCSDCGSPLDLREVVPQFAEDDEGRDIDYEIEYVRYQCGKTLVNGEIKYPCRYIAKEISPIVREE